MEDCVYLSIVHGIYLWPLYPSNAIFAGSPQTRITTRWKKIIPQLLTAVVPAECVTCCRCEDRLLMEPLAIRRMRNLWSQASIMEVKYIFGVLFDDGEQ